MKGTSTKAFFILLTIACAGLALLLSDNLLVKSQISELLNVAANARVNTLLENEREAAPLTRSGSKCLTFEETLDDLVASSPQVFVTMPAKAAGSSMKEFTNMCVGTFTGGAPGPNFPINQPGKWLEKAFTSDYELPSLITAHIYSTPSIVRIMENIPHTSLIIHMHRDETDRLISAIKQVAISRLCGEKPFAGAKTVFQTDGKRCVFSESDLMNKIIKARVNEIGFGEPENNSCEFYDAIEENRPRMVFVHYEQADKLQRVLSKYHCPDLLDAEKVHANVAKDKPLEAFLTLEANGKEVPLLDWLEKKRDMLEYTFASRAKQTCRGKSLNMQDDLLSCEDEVLQITRDTSF